MEGFIFTDHKEDFPKAIQDISSQVRSGKLKVRVDWTNGFEQAPEALRKLLLGKNHGKCIVRVEDTKARL